MQNVKYDSSYVKSVCVMISKGNISNINKLNEYLEYIDLEKEISIKAMELEMLLGENTNDINPKHYNGDSDFIYQYKPIDLIIYSCISDTHKKEEKIKLLKEIIKLEGIDFSDIRKSIEHVVSNGDLELFRLLNTLSINYEGTHNRLRNKEPYSVLDNCLSLVLSRLTVSGKEVADKYPKEILEYFLSMNKETIVLENLKITSIMLKCLRENDSCQKDIKDVKTLFEEIKTTIENYKF